MSNEPKVGQVWQSWDKRQRRPDGTSSGGHLRLIEELPNGFLCHRVRRLPGGGWERYGNATVPILRRRLRPNATGYRLVEETTP